jgi:murein DD-endopeptidase MepM/ murein hydrolase activator NlpD
LIVPAAAIGALALFAVCGKPEPKPFLFSSAEPNPETAYFAPTTETDLPQTVSLSPEEAGKIVPEYQKNMEAKLKKGDSLFEILKRKGVDPSQIHELVTAARRVHNLGRMQQNQEFSLDFDKRNGQILRFETDIDDSHRIVVERSDKKLQARKEAYEFEIENEFMSGTINESLFLAADEAGLSPILIIQMAEIFAWDIDFQVDMRRGDSFQVLYEKKCLDGQFNQLGRILASQIVNQGKPFWAFYFVGKNGKSDYYDMDGNSLRKAFLKSPLTYRRISSGFSFRRFHPILKTYRPHLGVDYAAPAGTSVRTIGDGRIIYAGWKKGFGRYIEVRHNETYTSTYGHLHRFAKGIAKGKYVEQGQTIGYVGSTGLATGPHLDFRLLKNGRFTNPLTVNLPDADPVNKKDMPAFKKQVEELVAEMGRMSHPQKVTNLPDRRTTI